MRRLSGLFFLLLLTVQCHNAVVRASSKVSAAGQDPWKRAQDLVAQMTLDEKLQFIQGNSSYARSLGPAKHYTGVVRGVPRLHIPDLVMNDGPMLECKH
eukprot:UC1_evm3s696